MNLDGVAENLEKAADYLRMNGHIKGRLLGNNPTVGELPPACAIGAIRESATDVQLGLSATAGPAAMLLAQTVMKRITGVVTLMSMLDTVQCQGKVAWWNDQAHITGEDVVEAMLETAKAIRNGEVS